MTSTNRGTPHPSLLMPNLEGGLTGYIITRVVILLFFAMQIGSLLSACLEIVSMLSSSHNAYNKKLLKRLRTISTAEPSINSTLGHDEEDVDDIQTFSKDGSNVEDPIGARTVRESKEEDDPPVQDWQLGAARRMGSLARRAREEALAGYRPPASQRMKLLDNLGSLEVILYFLGGLNTRRLKHMLIRSRKEARK